MKINLLLLNILINIFQFYNSYAATSPRLTFKNFKLSYFLKFNDFNEAPTNSLMMIS